jgi:hypothetical protein
MPPKGKKRALDAKDPKQPKQPKQVKQVKQPNKKVSFALSCSLYNSFTLLSCVFYLFAPYQRYLQANFTPSNQIYPSPQEDPPSAIDYMTFAPQQIPPGRLNLLQFFVFE